uniref:Glycosyltransferase n=1 Tax=Rubia yunnanensis TaxID=1650721 RepID=A0A896AHX6_9GENT|nr:glycosyltransferase [Rubia yunnanensis]
MLAKGHLVPAVELAKLLAARDEHLSIRVLLYKLHFDADADSYMQSLLSENTRRVQYVQLPDRPPQIPKDAVPNYPMLMGGIIESQKSQVREVLSELKSRDSGAPKLAGIVIDMFCTTMIDVANEHEVPAYVFYTSTASMIGLRHHVQTVLDGSDESADLREFSVSTYVNTVPSKLFPPVWLNKHAPYAHHTRRIISESKGILVNTFSELEPYAVAALTNNPTVPTIYPVGPLIDLKAAGKDNPKGDTIMKWLDTQPPSSVIFLCFGSMGCFDVSQLKEIAHAVENSGFRFLWSMRKPPGKEQHLAMPSEYDDFGHVLPEGFLERTSGIGRVTGWAPQTQVLGHPAVGGFVTHCGWNSVLESIWFGVPMAAWPLYAEQQMNAFSLVKEVGVAAEIKIDYMKDAPVLVGADQIEGGIREVMEGESGIRKKAKELMEKARNALVEGGSSYSSLGRFIEEYSN